MLFTKTLKKSYQFRYVYNHCKRFHSKYLVMCVVVNNTELNSLGISVSKKVGNSVTRNRITRLIREAYRLNENIFLKGYDIIFCAQSVSRYSDFSSICYSICTLANQLSLCKVKK